MTDLTQPGLSIVPAVWLSDGLTVTAGTMASAKGELGGPTDVACGPVTNTQPVECLAAGLLTVAGKQALRAWRIDVTGQPAGGAVGHELDLRACAAPPPAPTRVVDAAAADRAGVGRRRRDGLGDRLDQRRRRRLPDQRWTRPTR